MKKGEEVGDSLALPCQGRRKTLPCGENRIPDCSSGLAVDGRGRGSGVVSLLYCFASGQICAEQAWGDTPMISLCDAKGLLFKEENT